MMWLHSNSFNLQDFFTERRVRDAEWRGWGKEGASEQYIQCLKYVLYFAPNYSKLKLLELLEVFNLQIVLNKHTKWPECPSEVNFLQGGNKNSLRSLTIFWNIAYLGQPIQHTFKLGIVEFQCLWTVLKIKRVTFLQWLKKEWVAISLLKFFINLKGRWPRFQARAPPISFLTIEGRAAANPPPSI